MREFSERFEYVKQPHIIGLLALIILLVGIAIFTGTKRIGEINKNAGKTTEQRCVDYVNDRELCRFIAVQETAGFSNYISTTVEITDGQELTTTLEVESPDRMRSVTTELVAERQAYVQLDTTSYVKDYADGIWATYTDPTYTPETNSIVYDFSSATSEDTVLFRDNYLYVGSEACGSLTCLKYQVKDSERPNATAFLWFDNQSYLIQRYQSLDGTSQVETRYVYQPVTITAPSPVKTVSEDEIMQLLE